jgi:hypothetical protein
LFERVRIRTSQRGSIGRVYLTTRPPGLPPSVSPYQSASTYSATAQWYSVRCHCRVSKSFLWAITPGILRHAVGATARLMRRGEAYIPGSRRPTAGCRKEKEIGSTGYAPMLPLSHTMKFLLPLLWAVIFLVLR